MTALYLESRSITFLVQLCWSRNCCCILSTFWKSNFEYKSMLDVTCMTYSVSHTLWTTKVDRPYRRPIKDIPFKKSYFKWEQKLTCLTCAWFFLNFRNFSISACRFGFLCFCSTSNISSVLFGSVPRIFWLYRDAFSTFHRPWTISALVCALDSL